MVNTYEDALGWIGDETTRLFDIAIETIPSGSSATFVELGTYRGKSSICLYDKIQESGKDITLYTVDNWSMALPHDQPGDDNRSIFIENKGTRNINLIDSSSVEASDLFATQSIDFLFIDTNSQWNKFVDEIHAWVPKIKSGSIISGHDYQWDGVKWIVDDVWENRTVITETISHTAEFPDIQPPSWSYTCWYGIASENQF